MDLAGNMSTTTQNTGGDDIVSRIAATFEPTDVEQVESASPKQETPESTMEAEQTDIEDEITVEATDETEEGEEHPEKAASDAEESDDTVELEAEQLAQVLGIDEGKVLVDEEGHLAFQTKVGDDIGKVKLKDLLASYQTEAYLTKKSQSLSEARKEFESAREEETRRVEAQIGEAAAVTQLLEQQLTSAYRSIDWNALRAQNPAEWSAKKQEFTDLVGNINQIKARAHEVLMNHVEQKTGRTDAQMQEHLSAERDKLLSVMPEFNDPEIAQKSIGAMQEFLVDTNNPYHFTPDEVAGVTDHRLIMMAIDAQKYRDSLKKRDVATKKVKKLPKLVKTGAKTQSKAAAKKAVMDQKRVRLKRTGNIQDAAAALMDII